MGEFRRGEGKGKEGREWRKIYSIQLKQEKRKKILLSLKYGVCSTNSMC